MAAKKVGKFILSVDVEGLNDITGLQRALKGLEKSANPTARQLKSLGQSVRQVTKFTPKTISQFQQKERILKKLRQEVNVNGRQFQILGKAIDANRIKLQKFNNTAKKGTNLRAGFGNLIAAQVLPGNFSRFAALGNQIAGPKGALIGAGIGGIMDLNFAELTKDAAKFAGNIKRLEVALKGVTKTQEEFAKAQRVISSVSDELNVPIANATKQFTTLSASVIGAGGSVNDAELVFRGVSEAIKATGGDAEDVKSAIRAMSQIFGKGKVSAEELQGQLGERLPGAVVKFAEATGRTLPQLQKDLRDGTVGLNDVMKFVVKLSGDHANAAREMANSTADAGQRMQVALDKLKLSFGKFFQPIGAGFQDIITGFANMVNAALETRTLVRMLELDMGRKESGSFAMEALQEAREQATQIARLRAGKFTEEDYKNKTIQSQFAIGMDKPIDMNLYRKLESQIFRDLLRGKALEEGILPAPVTGSDLTNFMSPTGDDDGKADQKLQKQLDFIEETRQAEEQAEEEKYNAFLDFQLLSGQITQTKYDQIKLDQQAVEISEELGINLDYVKEALNRAKESTFDFKAALKEVFDTATDLGTNIEKLAVSSIDKFGDAFADLVVTGKSSFAELTRSILADLQRMIVKAIFFKTLFNLVPGLEDFLSFGNGGVVNNGEVEASANGNVFAKNKIVPYQMGGIVSRPTIFPMKNGAGLMGEAGPEAIMPLKRGANGKLGVQASGGVGNIVVNVDAKGSSVEGNEMQGRQLGRMIAMAVQSELVEQQRPGGLLR
jgi:lambda family phage tail tape measure protein